MVSAVFKKYLLHTNNVYEAHVFPFNIYPKAIYYKGNSEKTYFVWLDTNFNPFRVKIQAYNHVTKTWGSVVQIGPDNELAGRGTPPGQDAHLFPAIGVLPNKKLIVFYGAHSSTNLLYRISTNSEDETSWGLQRNLPIRTLGWTYPQPCSFSDKLVLFCRDSTDYTPGTTVWCMNTTTDGITWSGWTVIVDFGANRGPYFLFRKVTDNIIIVAGTNLHTDATPECRNVYFAYSDDKGATWKNANGTTITLPMDEDQKIADTDYPTYTFGCQFPIIDEDGRPIVTGHYRLVTGWVNHRLFLCQYSAPLGQVGLWMLTYAKDEAASDLLLLNAGYEYPYFRKGRIHFLSALDLDSKPRAFRRIPGSVDRFESYYIDGETVLGGDSAYIISSEIVENSHNASEPYSYFSHEQEGAILYKLRARTVERQAEGLPRKFDGTFILDGYLDHNKIIDYLEHLEEKE